MLIAAWQAAPIAAQEADAIEFGVEDFDVTGAGQLELGDIDTVLRPFRRQFSEDAGTLDLEVTVRRDGAITDCVSEGSDRLNAAGLALCQHTIANGRFTLFPVLLLDFEQATYRVSLGRFRRSSAGDATLFWTRSGYPLRGHAVRFGEYEIPPMDQRLRLSDINAKPMRYPPRALRHEVEAQVRVVVDFADDGTVQSCRPVYSSNTSRIAYDTCLEAAKAFTLMRAPDARPLIWLTRWQIEAL